MPTYALKSDLTAEVNRAKAAEVKETQARVAAANALVAADQSEASTRGGSDAALQRAIDALGAKLDALTSRVTALEPAPSPAPTPPPPTTTGWAGKPAFLSYPASGPLTFNDAHDVEISGKSFRNIAFPDAAITLNHCQGTVTITDCDFAELGWDILDILNDSVIDALDFGWYRFRNLGTLTVAQYEAAGARAGADLVQLDHSTAAGRMHDGKGYGAHNEDLVSVQAGSGGPDAAHPLIHEDCQYESPLPPDPGAWLSTSGSCGMTEGAQHFVTRRCTFLNVAQAGLGYNGGTDIHHTDNVIYIARRANSNVGLYTLVAPKAGDLEMARNRVWAVSDKSGPNASSLAGGVQPTGWATNVLQDASIDPATLKVVL